MSDLQTLFTEAVTLHQQGQLAEAKKRYIEVLQSVPDNINVLANLAIVCRDLGELHSAEEYCRRTVTCAPEDPAQHLNLGAVLEAKDDLEGAKKCYQTAFDLAPTHPKVLNNLGKLLHQQGRVAEGLNLIEKAVTVEPNYPLALNNLGVIYSEQGDLEKAERCLEKSVTLDSGNIQSLYNLAGVYNGRNDVTKAIKILEKLQALDPSHQPAIYMLAALSGKTPTTAPRKYVEETFDKYASRFDTHIQHKLGYTAPKALAEIVSKHLVNDIPFAQGADLGCGTGLSGASFTSMVTNMTGIDVSLKMLEKAQEKEVYDNVEQCDIIEFLQKTEELYDLFIAADVFIYIGDIQNLFSLLSEKSTPRAVIACSIERSQEADQYKILQSGRFGHNPAYLEACAQQNGFQVVYHTDHNIRKEDNSWLPGDLYIFQKGG